MSKKMDKVITELLKYVELEGTEIGEVCTHLIDTYDYPDYISKEFKIALEKELKEQLQNFKDNCIIISLDPHISTHIVKDLVWKD